MVCWSVISVAHKHRQAHTAALPASWSPPLQHHCDTPLPCYAVLQTFQEEAEFQAGIDDTRGKRRAAGSSTAGQQSQATLLAREEELAAQQLQDAALAYVRCLQHLLQASNQQNFKCVLVDSLLPSSQHMG